MHLELGGEILPVNQLGPDFVWVEAAHGHPAIDARLVVSVDGHLTTRPVRLPEGVRAGRGRALIIGA